MHPRDFIQLALFIAALVVIRPLLGRLIWAAMFALFVAGFATVWWAELQRNPVLNLTAPLEGKEVRFGTFGSALFATVTTDASCGAVNSTHDSLAPLAVSSR